MTEAFLQRLRWHNIIPRIKLDSSFKIVFLGKYFSDNADKKGNNTKKDAFFVYVQYESNSFFSQFSVENQNRSKEMESK